MGMHREAELIEQQVKAKQAAGQMVPGICRIRKLITIP